MSSIYLAAFVIAVQMGLVAAKLLRIIHFSWWLVWLPGLLCLAALIYVVIVAVWFTDYSK